jgi:hypothetical protein
MSQTIGSAADNHNGDVAAAQVLLMLDSFVDGDEYIEFSVGQGQEFTIRYARPSCFLGCSTLVAVVNQKGLQLFGSALVEQDPH